MLIINQDEDEDNDFKSDIWKTPVHVNIIFYSSNLLKFIQNIYWVHSLGIHNHTKYFLGNQGSENIINLAMNSNCH